MFLSGEISPIINLFAQLAFPWHAGHEMQNKSVLQFLLFYIPWAGNLHLGTLLKLTFFVSVIKTQNIYLGSLKHYVFYYAPHFLTKKKQHILHTLK